MRKLNKIVRTKTIHYNKLGDSYEVDLMTFENYLLKSEYILMSTEFKLHPYKWYDLRWIVDKPFYYLSRLFNNQTNNALNLNNTKSITIRIAIFLTETLSGYGLIELIKIIF